TLAVTTLWLMVANLALSVLAPIIELAQGGMGRNPLMAPAGGLAQGVNLLGTLVGLAAFFTFMFYLRSLALFVREDDLARNIMNYVIAVVVSTVLGIIMLCVGGFAMGIGMAGAMGKGGNPNAGGGAMVGGFLFLALVGCGVLVVAIVMLIWYIRI